MRVFILLVAVVTAVVSGHCLDEPRDTNEAKPLSPRQVWEADIRRLGDRVTDLFQAQDFKAVSEFYTKDCILMPPGSYPVRGKEAVANIFSSLSEHGTERASYDNFNVTASSSRMAVETGSFYFRKAQIITSSVKYLAIWKRIRGQPKIYIEIWNESPRDVPVIKRNN